MADLIPVFVRTDLNTPDEGRFLCKADPDDLERILDSMRQWGVGSPSRTSDDDQDPLGRYFVYGAKTGFEIIVSG